MSTTEENNWLCECGHPEDNHDLGPCWICFGLHLDDNQNNIPVNRRHTLCDNYKRDNLRFLEQEYERLSKRIW
jgi:hypothetical protein